jgi:hypothetical protein
MPQSLDVASDCDAQTIARTLDSEAELVTPDLHPGEFFIFAGRLWHGSNNSGYQTRHALLIQYTSVDNKVRIPLSFDEPIDWWESYRPPCVLVAGKANSDLNQIASRPALNPLRRFLSPQFRMK